MTNEKSIAKPSTNFNLHIGGDGVKTDVNIPRETTTFCLSVFAVGLVAYLAKGWIGKAMSK